ncbi:MAG: oxidoreductase [Candidatus Scalindua rubra]|uniref:Oxidoreductase n=1 Tax=Candidatus Scalindua rubra TaxID=1872076 RepID=A0A1E3XG27_9BACT|nr:MAG: oxidoreductase [Candidatus Scalindua rubra]
MKVVLVSTDYTKVAMGVRTLSSCLLEQGFATSIVLMQDENYKKFQWEGLYSVCKDADLIGISCMTHSVKKAIEVKQALESRTSAKCVIGGIHASLDPESLLEYFDLVCHGEGEDVIVELARCLSNMERYDDIQGLWIKNASKVTRNQSIPLQRNIDKYPLPDYDLKHQFIIEGNHLVPMKPVPLHIEVDSFVVLGSRGCPHHCNYCSNQKLKQDFAWRKRVRHYSIDYLINHLKSVCRTFPMVRSFWIEDDTFFAKKIENIEEFAQRYKKEIGKPFKVLISPWTYKEEKIKPLIDAGMNELIMGIQSGSENVNKNIYGRNLSNDKILKIAYSLHKYSPMTIYYDFIVLNPFETVDDLVSTIRFMKKLPTPFFIFNNSLAFYPKTQLYEWAVKEGLDVSRRVQHFPSYIGYDVLRYENIHHKILHFVLLLMAGKASSFRIGKIPRVLTSEPFIYFYKLIDTKTTNRVVTILCSLLVYVRWKMIIKKLLGPKLTRKLMLMSYKLRDLKEDLMAMRVMVK